MQRLPVTRHIRPRRIHPEMRVVASVEMRRAVVLVASVSMAGRLGVLAPLRGMIRLLSRAFDTASRVDENRWESTAASCHPSEVKQTFYVFLWPHPGMDQALIAYEDAVLTLVDEHDGKVVHRARTDGADGRPLEIQLFEWASREALDSYMSDPRRIALAAHRERAIARTDIVPVQLSSSF